MKPSQLSTELDRIAIDIEAVDLADKAAVAAIYNRLNAVRLANLKNGAYPRSHAAFEWAKNFSGEIEKVAVVVRAAWSLHKAA